MRGVKPSAGSNPAFSARLRPQVVDLLGVFLFLILHSAGLPHRRSRSYAWLLSSVEAFGHAEVAPARLPALQSLTAARQEAKNKPRGGKP